MFFLFFKYCKGHIFTVFIVQFYMSLLIKSVVIKKEKSYWPHKILMYSCICNVQMNIINVELNVEY